MKLQGDLEFFWQGSASLGESSEMWIHMMDEHYCTPDGFNWEHGVTQNLPSGDGPPPVVFDPPSEFSEANAYERYVGPLFVSCTNASSFLLAPVNLSKLLGHVLRATRPRTS